MENDIAKSPAGLVTAAGDAANAVAVHGGGIGILQNPENKIRADIAALLLAMNTVETAKAELATRRTTVRGLVRDSRNLLTMGRDVLKPILGSEHSEAWTAVGLTDSLAIPRPAEEVQALLLAFKAYFLANPGQEVDPRDVMAIKYDEFFIGLDTSRAAVREQELVLGEATRERDAKARLLRKRLRDLIEELNMRLDPLDLRWKAFGFNMPGAQETPDIPENVVVTLINNTTAALKWNAAPRAEYYHVWKKVVGVDEELVAVGSPADLDFTIEALPANATIELAVSAVNNGGESQPSEVVRIVTH